MSTTALPTSSEYPSPFSESDLYEVVVTRYTRFLPYRVPAPAEPPVGTVVTNRFGTRLVRFVDHEGHDGWGTHAGYGLPVTGELAGGEWGPMWRAMGPLTVS